MEKVPQIVSERLKATNVDVNHPDADLLTAFSERTLSAGERALVLAHLALCMECREVVALALPPTDSVQEVARPSKAAWFTWPVLRWGAVAAGVVLVGTFGIIEYQHRQEAAANIAYRSAPALEKEAKNVLPAVPTQELTQDKQKSAPAQSPRAAKSETAAASGASPASEPPTMLLRRQLPVAGAQRGPQVQFQQSSTFQNQAQGSLAVPSAPARVAGGNLPVPKQSEAVEVASAPAAVNNEIARLDAGAAQIGPQSAQLDSKVERSKPATPIQMTAEAPPPSPAKTIGGTVAGRNMARLVAASPAATVTWNINSSGGLQRSFDQGTTWQNVDVNRRADNAPPTAFHGAAKEMPSDALKKDASSPTFRAVASNGPDVWAGASGGLLYHSADAGAHWVRVVPSSAGTSLSGDILSLEFPDPQHGRVVTAAPEVWITADGGQTWQKQ